MASGKTDARPLQLVRFALQVSRPALWIATIWLYLVPTGARPELLQTGTFWLGLCYCTLPLNLLVFHWNDYFDVEVDRANPRKGNFLFGARGSANELRALVPWTAALQVPFVLALLWLRGSGVLLFFAGMLLSNYVYNNLALKSVPVVDLIGPLGYILVIYLSEVTNDVQGVPAASWGHSAFFVVRTQMWGQLMDLDVDRAGGRRTTAVSLGSLSAGRVVLLFLLLLEVAFVFAFFEDAVVRGFSCLSVLVAVVADGKFQQTVVNLLTHAVLGGSGLGLLIYTWRDGILSGVTPAVVRASTAT